MQEEIFLLKDAAHEIEMLRRQNNLMRTRLEMFDNMMLLFGTQPAYKVEGMSPDVVFAIEKFIATKEPQLKNVTN